MTNFYVREVEGRPHFGKCLFCGKILATQEEAHGHCPPCKAKHETLHRAESPCPPHFARAQERTAQEIKRLNDPVNRPRHYTEHPSKVECIEVTEHMNFCMGNAMKYLWRADMKGGVEDLKKALWYIEREITRRES